MNLARVSMMNLARVEYELSEETHMFTRSKI